MYKGRLKSGLHKLKNILKFEGKIDQKALNWSA